MNSKYIVFPGYGVVTKADDPEFSIITKNAYTEGDTLTVVSPDDSETVFDAKNVSEDGKTGRIKFEADGSEYLIRELSEDDGYWLSKYKTWLPMTAIKSLINSQAKDIENVDLNSPIESLEAYASDSSVYVVGLVYTNALGQWTRVGGDWVLTPTSDATFEGMISIPITPDKADDFIKLYDDNYVTVADTEQYEEAPAETE